MLQGVSSRDIGKWDHHKKNDTSEERVVRDEILEIRKKGQQKIPSNENKYRTLNIEVINKCKQAKVEWLNEKYMEIERMSIVDKASKQKRIKRTNVVLNSRLYKIKRGNADNRKWKILRRWNEFFSKLFHEEKEKLAIHKNMEGTEILN